MNVVVSSRKRVARRVIRTSTRFGTASDTPLLRPQLVADGVAHGGA